MDRASGRVQAITVRLFNPASGEWSIYWSAGSGWFDVPMVGSFDGPRGVFYAQEPFEGRHIFSRFIWTVRAPSSCRWEQAYSADGGGYVGDELDDGLYPVAVMERRDDYDRHIEGLFSRTRWLQWLAEAGLPATAEIDRWGRDVFVGIRTGFGVQLPASGSSPAT